MDYFMENVKKIKPGVKMILKSNWYGIPKGSEIELVSTINEGDKSAVFRGDDGVERKILLWEVQYPSDESFVYPYSTICRLRRDVVFPDGTILRNDDKKLYEIIFEDYDLYKSIIAIISPTQGTKSYWVLADAIIPGSIMEESSESTDIEKQDPEPQEESSIKNDILDDKLRWDLLPMEEIEDIVRVYHAGAKKYGPNKWQNLPNGFERYRAAMMRHLIEYMKGNKTDSDTGCLHLAQVCWNAIAMLWYDKHGKGLITSDKEER